MQFYRDIIQTWHLKREKRKLYYRGFTSILVVLTTTALGRMTVKYVKKKKKRLRGRQEEEGTASGLSVGGGVLPYMGYTPYISA